MPTFEDNTSTTAAPEEVWKLLYDPMRFPDWWSGFERVAAGDAKGGDADITVWPAGYPDFPMPQLVRTTTRDHRVVVSCTISDLIFDWRLEALEPGTKISVRVEIPEAETARLETQQRVVAQSLRKLAELARTS